MKMRNFKNYSIHDGKKHLKMISPKIVNIQNDNCKRKQTKITSKSDNKIVTQILTNK